MTNPTPETEVREKVEAAIARLSYADKDPNVVIRNDDLRTLLASHATLEARATAQAQTIKCMSEVMADFADFADQIDAETEGFEDSDPVALVLVPDEENPVEMKRVPISAFRQVRAALSKALPETGEQSQ